MRVLIVEDTEERANFLAFLYRFQELVVVNSASKAIKYLSIDKFDVVSLDYNLSESATGEDIASFISTNKLDLIVIIHSENPIGANKIKGILCNAYLIPISKIHAKNRQQNELRAFLSQPISNEIGQFKNILSELALKD